MSYVATYETAPDRDVGPSIRLRTRLLALAAACVVGGLALAAGFALHWATLEQRSIESQALTSARATVHAADREISASIARMEALATSPALRAGDLKAFHDQLIATPLPDGTWFILWDGERQLLNTLRPFGSPLPRIADFHPASQTAIRRAFATRQPVISPVVWGVVAQTYLVSVGIPVVADNEVTHFFDTILSDRRISRVIEEQPLPPGWRSILVDRNRGTIAHAGMAERPSGPGVPEAWADLLRGSGTQGTFFGDRGDAPVLVAFARSSMSDWTAVVEVPWTGATAPMRRTLRLLAAAGAALAIAAAAVALLIARGADRPIKALRAERKRAEHERDEALALFRGIAETSPEIVYVLDLGTGRIRYVNRRVADVLGYGPDELDAVAEDTLWAFFHPRDAAGAGDRFRRLGALADGEVATGEHRLRHRDGGWRWLAARETVFARGGDGAVTRVLGCAHDITEARLAQEAVRRLGGSLLTLQDDERRRIARELHDSTAQILLGASFATQRIRAVSPVLTEDADDAIEEALSLIEEGQREIRTLAYLLHPPLLDEMGLPAALRWYAKGLARRGGLAIAVEVAPELERRRLPRDAESALFRVAQEALGNACRHSGGTMVRVRMETNAGALSGDACCAVLLAVQDDGRGIAGAQAAPANNDDDPVHFGVGLVGMRERMRQLGGRLTVGPADPCGTIVEGSLPIDSAPGSDEGHPLSRPSVAELAWSGGR
jgi:PAS domain S-box-containing protein